MDPYFTTITSTSQQESAQFHDRFNFKDGNIILSVTGRLPILDARQDDRFRYRDPPSYGPSQTVWFKVHRGILNARSLVFEDMLGMPPPSPEDTTETSDTIDGLPVVTLHDDLEGIIRLLIVLYYSESVPQEPLMQKTWDFWPPVLKLCDKYQIKRISSTVLPRLQADWPTTLSAWDLNESHVGRLTEFRIHQHMNTGIEPQTSLDKLLAEPCAVIRFGRTLNVQEVLPSAFYHLSRLSPLNDLRTEGPNMTADLHQMNDGRTANRALLESSDYEALLVGQASIREWIKDFANPKLAPDDRGFKSWLQFHKRRSDCLGEEWWEKYISPPILELLGKKEMDPLKWLQGFQISIGGLCKACRRVKDQGVARARYEFWKALPGFFGINVPSWGESDASKNWQVNDPLFGFTARFKRTRWFRDLTEFYGTE